MSEFVSIIGEVWKQAPFELSEIPNEIKDSFWDIYYRYEGTTDPDKRREAEIRMNGLLARLKIKWNGSNVLLGYFVRCLISDKSNPPKGMKFFADFFESSTGKRMNLATATYEEGKDFDKKRGSLRESFEKAVDILRECGFINVEFTSERSN